MPRIKLQGSVIELSHDTPNPQVLRIPVDQARLLAIDLLAAVYPRSPDDTLMQEVSLVVSNPACGWSAVEDGNISLRVSLGAIRPIEFVFDNDQHVQGLVDGLGQLLRVPRYMRATPASPQ